jgi:co-chaperonin GroES (HSP10)
MRSVLVILFCFICARTLAQETSVSGIIFDADSKDRLSRVNVLNLTTGASVYNNINGVFTIDVTPGDKLVFKQAEHFADTIKIQSYIPLAIYLRRIAIQLKQVNIFDTLMDPQKRMAQKRRDYSMIYGSIASKDFLTLTPGAGVGLGIDAIYNSISRKGRNAAHLRETIENDYRRDVVDYRFNKTMVGRITGLKGQQLTDFMNKYRPGYYFLANASEYEFITSIKTNLRRYLRNPGAHTQLPLYEPKK